ncbi:hypothetical protein B0H13DRAFT_1873764 [Mycena leptocephala]|nr:hypothetical protein B0H13DRAFT_1873764 [Mycena leptocephala]
MNNNNNSMRRFIRVDPARVETVVRLRLRLGPDVDENNLVIVIGFDRSSTRMPANLVPLPSHNTGEVVVRDRMRANAPFVLHNIDGSDHNADGVALSNPLVTTASFAPLPGHNAGDIVVRDRMRVLRNIDGSHHNADGFRPPPGHNAREIVVRDRMRVGPAAVPTDGVLVPDHNVGEIVHRDNNLDEDPQQVLGKMIVLTLLFVVERRLKAPGVVVDDGPGIWDLVILAFLVAYFVYAMCCRA